ncbi:hypothetical protein MHJ_0685 [Mesomycoplasma hyopneumoniae J]|uniref:Uncharacterized protein n=1 Tax=Mesomycoplasma hyopneumoniae (strain J / ATCC 25934 / NCTC 10110) TaxID=262719 RepID=Q4AA38_MESHJ|nr:hypothetical protein MHJ_0685 [Mesomycoplasma hyopneumoniae J]
MSLSLGSSRLRIWFKFVSETKNKFLSKNCSSLVWVSRSNKKRLKPSPVFARIIFYSITINYFINSGAKSNQTNKKIIFVNSKPIFIVSFSSYQSAWGKMKWKTCCLNITDKIWII